MLKGLCIEIDKYQNLKLENNRDVITFAQFVERSHVFKFLSGSNLEYDLVRAQILGTNFLLFLLPFTLFEVRRLVEWS